MAQRRRFGPAVKGAVVGLGLSAATAPFWLGEGVAPARVLFFGAVAAAGCAACGELLGGLRGLRPRWLRAALRGGIAGAALAAGGLLALGLLPRQPPEGLDVALFGGLALAAAGWSGAAAGASLHFLARAARGARRLVRHLREQGRPAAAPAEARAPAAPLRPAPVSVPRLARSLRAGR